MKQDELKSWKPRKFKLSKPNMAKKLLLPSRLHIIVSILFSLIMVTLTFTKVIYVPISNERLLDLSLIPVMFAAMIGGYGISIPLGIGWALLSFTNIGDRFTLEWLLAAKLGFTVACTYFYGLFRKAYPRSPSNVYRTIIASIFTKDIIVTLGTLDMFPHTAPSLWLRDTGIQMVLELVLCFLSMALLIKHLREIHILNGVRKKGEKKNECDVSV